MWSTLIQKRDRIPSVQVRRPASNAKLFPWTSHSTDTGWMTPLRWVGGSHCPERAGRQSNLSKAKEGKVHI